MDSTIDLTISFVKGFSSTDYINASASTGDFFMWSLTCTLFLILTICLIVLFIYKKRTSLNIFSIMFTKIDSQKISVNNQLTNTNLQKLFTLIIIAVLSALSITALFIGNIAFANNSSPLKPDTNNIEATVYDDGHIDFSSCEIINQSDMFYTISSSSLTITDEIKDKSSLENSVLNVRGFNGVLYNDRPDGKTHEVSNIKLLEPNETTNLVFSLSNLDINTALLLCDKTVFKFSLQPKKITDIPPSLELNIPEVDEMDFNESIELNVTSNSIGSISVNSTEYLEATINNGVEKKIIIKAIKSSDSPQEITIHQEAAGSYAEGTVTFTVNKINEKKTPTITLEPQSVDSLTIGETKDVIITTDSPGDLHAEPIETDCVSAEINEDIATIKALKASEEVNYVTIYVDETEDFSYGYQIFTVKKINKKPLFISLNPSSVSNLTIDEYKDIEVQTESDGEITATSSDYLSGEAQANPKIIRVRALKASDSTRKITIKQEATDIYSGATAEFSVETIDKKNTNLSLEPSSIDVLKINQTTEVQATTNSDGQIIVNSNEYLSGSSSNMTITIKALKVSDSPQTITVIQNESETFKQGTAIFTVNKINEKKTPTITLTPQSVASLTIDEIKNVSINTDSPGVLHAEPVETDCLSAEINDKIATVKALKASDEATYVKISVDEAEEYLYGYQIFTVEKITKKNVSISLNPASVANLTIDAYIDVEVQTGSDGSITAASTEYLSGEAQANPKIIRVSALKASNTLQKITIKQEATDIYTEATAEFSVETIDKKNTNLSLEPSSIDELKINQTTEVQATTNSDGQIIVNSNEYLSGSTADMIITINALKYSDAPQTITITQNESETFKQGTAVFTVNKIPKIIPTITLNPAFIENLYIGNTANVIITTDSDGSIFAWPTEYLSAEINNIEKKAVITAKKLSNTPQTLTISQAATDKYAEKITTFTVNQINKRDANFKLNPSHIDSLGVNGTTQVIINTDSDGSIYWTNTEYLKAERSGNNLTITALKKSDEEQTITFYQTATDKFYDGSATFTVTMINGKDTPTISLSPESVDGLTIDETKSVTITTNSDGVIEAIPWETDCLSAEITDKTATITAEKASEVETYVVVYVNETETYSEGYAIFTVKKINKKPLSISLSPASVSNLTLDEFKDVTVQTGSDGEISASSTDYLAGAILVNPKVVRVIALKASNVPQKITIKQEATEIYAEATAEFSVETIDKKTTSISLAPSSIEMLTINQSTEVEASSNSDGQIVVNSNEYLSGSSVDMTITINALKVSDSPQTITITQNETETFKQGTAVFTVNKIPKIIPTIALNPNPIESLYKGESAQVTVTTSSDGVLSVSSTEYLSSTIESANTFSVNALKPSGTVQQVTVKLAETEFYYEQTSLLTVNFIRNYKSLDWYSLEELAEISEDISKNGENSIYYAEMNSFMENGSIWYSGSKDTYDCSLAKQKKVTENMKQYCCSFRLDGEGNPDTSDVNNYLFLRIIGINHDYKAGSKTERAGLTFQTKQALWKAFNNEDGDEGWWSNTNLRKELQSGGEIYSKLNPRFLESIISVDKYTQSNRDKNPNIKVTQDKLFVPSYSEHYQNNGITDRSWYGNGLNSSGDQAFDPNNPKTEGYCYEYWKYKEVDGQINNLQIWDLNYQFYNLNARPDGSTWEGWPDGMHQRNYPGSWLRSVKCSNDSEYMYIKYNSCINAWRPKTEDLSINPCFCLGKSKGLDYYSIEDLTKISEDISKNGELSYYWYEFNEYLRNGEIWYSGSEGTYDPDQKKPTENMKKYCCSFILNRDGSVDESKINNYLFLRIIGINHDYEMWRNDYRAGITFQIVNALPDGCSMGTASSQWWGTENVDNMLRNKLQDGGEIFEKLNPKFINNIIPVRKYSQTARTANVSISYTHDKLFLPSYSEMWQNDGSSMTSQRSWYDNGRNAKGVQIFDPDNPQTEGYCYEWQWFNQVNGSSENELLNNSYLCNDGIAPDGVSANNCWERSVNYSKTKGFMSLSENGAINCIDNDDCTKTYSIRPCFCFGAQSGLDYYSIEELTAISEDISENGEASRYWEEFNFYVNSDAIWYSGSKGTYNPVQNTPTDNMKPYCCSFITDTNGNPDTTNINNYLFLRVIGINHDYKANSKTDRAGLTFQVVNALPNAYEFSSSDAEWWGSDCLTPTLRDKMQPDGEIYAKLNSKFTNNIITVDKYSQTLRQSGSAINFSQDKMFLPSYSEIWQKNKSDVYSPSWYNNGRNSSTGQQTFSPENPNTEGYCYEWYWNQHIDGKAENQVLANSYLCNDKSYPLGTIEASQNYTWHRSKAASSDDRFACSKDLYISYVHEYNYLQAIRPCFCLGNNSGLDYYSLEELNNVSQDIAKNGEKSKYWNEFNKYMQEDSIWYSYSQGAYQYKLHRPTNSMKQYCCSFLHKDDGTVDESNINNYLFLRIIGINHDYQAGSKSKRAGLTFQVVNALPKAYRMNVYQYSSDIGWPTSELRSKMQTEIYDQLNDKFKNTILGVDKYSHYENWADPSKVKITNDKLFIPSYGEMWAKNIHDDFAAKPGFFNGRDADGNQIFDPNKPTTEGYCYEWYWYNNIDGKSSNLILRGAYYCNDGQSASGAEDAYTYSRTYYGGDDVITLSHYLCTDAIGVISDSRYDQMNYLGIRPCFCLGAS